MKQQVPMAPDASPNMERNLAFYYDGNCQSYVIWETARISRSEKSKILLMRASDSYNGDAIIDAMLQEIKSWGYETTVTTPYNTRICPVKYHLHRTPMVDDRIIALNQRLAAMGDMPSNYGASILLSKQVPVPTTAGTLVRIDAKIKYHDIDPPQSWRDRPPLL